MNTKMLLTAKLDQRLVMNQQLRQAITLLQYTTLDLTQLVQQYIETNPLLEMPDHEIHDELEDYARTHAAKYSSTFKKSNITDEDINTLENYSMPRSLRDHLLEQAMLCKFSDQEYQIAEAIIDVLDENGYLTMSMADLNLTLGPACSATLATYEKVLHAIQAFDPVGIGACDVQECLLLQLKAKNNGSATWVHAYQLISEQFDELYTNQPKKLAAKLKLTLEEYANALALIRTLNPKPGLQYLSDLEGVVTPELYVKKIKNAWRVFLTNSILTNLKINSQYQEIIKQHKKHESYEALNRELQEAQWLLKGLQRRNDTLLKVAIHIVELQKDFLEYGPQHMKPLNIIDVSQALNLHESTVSRVTTGKYMATPRGMFELKYFFPSYVLTESGAACSATTVKDKIKEFISQESSEHRYSDGEIAALLKQQGINVARRTVAKYREAMKILPAYQRTQQQFP